MTATIATVTGATGAQASGNSTQRHIVYAQNSAVWWAFWVDPATPTVLRSAYSPDLVTWTAGATVTLAQAVGNTADGRYISVAYASIGTTDAVHVFCSCAAFTGFDVRGVLTSNSVTWATNTVTNGNTTNSPAIPDGPAIIVASDGGVLLTSSLIDTAANFGDNTHTYNATADTTGGSWTPGAWATVDDHITSAVVVRNHAMAALASGNVLALWPADANPPTNVVYSLVGRNTTVVAPVNAFGSSSAFTDTTANEWGVCARTPTDIHCVRRTGANSYEHIRFNGSTWSAGQSIPAQTSKASSGIALTTDGVRVYLAVIDSAAGNAVQGVTWSNGAWGNWGTLESSSATRANISAVAECSGAAKIPFMWTEGAASPFAVNVASITVPTSSGGLLLRGVNI